MSELFDDIMEGLEGIKQHKETGKLPEGWTMSDHNQSFSTAKIRHELKLTQKNFASIFGFQLRTLQKWENGESKPPQAVQSYISLIEKDPKAILNIALQDNANGGINVRH